MDDDPLDFALDTSMMSNTLKDVTTVYLNQLTLAL